MKTSLQKNFFNGHSLRILSKWPLNEVEMAQHLLGGGAGGVWRQSGSILALSKTAQTLENGTFGWHEG